jgi:hypothetical protein
MTSKEAAAAELAEEMIRLLEAQRRLGPPSYPLTVRRLIELGTRHAPVAQIDKAIGKRSFQKRVVIARAKNREAPIVLASDLEALAGSRLLLEFMLHSLRTPSNQAFSAAQLKAKTSRKLQQSFQTALDRQIEEGSLPPTVGWITISRTKKLFLLADLHMGRQESGVTTLRPTAPPSIRAEGPSAGDRLPVTDPASPFAQAFDRAFDELDRRAGAHNFVSLVDLRAALPMAREAFDGELQELRRAGRYGLSAAEGRHGLSPEEQDAAIVEDGTLLLYVARKMP